MLQRDKNIILTEIKICKHKPFDYKKTESKKDNYSVFEISRINTPFSFTINTLNEDRTKHTCFFTEYKPGYPKSKQYPSYSWENTPYILNQFREWIYNHINPYLEDYRTPDLWEEMENQFILACEYDTYDNIQKIKRIDEGDKVYIAKSLYSFQEVIEKNYKLDKEQLKDINLKIDYLVDAIDHLNKPDWKGVLLSSMIGIATNLCVDSNGFHNIFSILKNQFET